MLWNRWRPARRLAGLILTLAATVAATVGTPAVAAEDKAITYAIEGPPESLDPAKGTSLESIKVTWHLCDALLDISADGHALEPRLAESWSLSDDGLEAVIRLRPDLRFHDGRPIDAAAVEASIERQFRPTHKLYTATPENAHEALLSTLVEDIAVRDEHTLAIRFEYPGLHYLSQIAIVSPEALEELGEDFGRRPVCSGPFEFASWSENDIVLAANEDYWQRRPLIDRLVFRLISDGAAMVGALLNGEVDFVPHIPDPVFFERLQEDPRIRLEQVFGLNVSYLGFYMERPPFDDPNLRKAVVAGVNVPRAILFLGRGATAPAQGPLSPAMTFYDPAVAQPPYDPAAAAELLSRAGVGHGLEVGLVYNDSITFIAELAGAIQSDLRRLGIGVELIGKPSWREMIDAVRAREGDMFLYGWNLRAPYPERLLIPLFHSRSIGTTNLTHYQDPVVDQLLDAVLRVMNEAEQQRIYSDIQNLIIEGAPMLFLYHRIRVAAYSDRIRRLEFNLGGHPHDKLVKADVAP